jgi:putative tricarboxylic transport membrane protein
MRANDAITGLLLIGLAAFMIYLTLGFPLMPGQDYGPALFPRILGAGLILCAVLLVVRGLGERAGGAPWLKLAPWTRDPWRIASFGLVLALIIAYVLLSEAIGFIITAFVLLLTLFLWFRARPLPALLTAAAATWGIHWFFATMLRVPLPRGLLNTVL